VGTRPFFCFCALLVFVSGLFACQSDPQSARGVAERFLDAHYVQINLEAAKVLCIGLARSRVEDEIRLTSGAVIDANTRPPQVYYKLIEEKARNERNASLLYETTFAVAGAGQFTKRILLTLRQDEGDWRITNFKEFD
jgi:hypothetical protein